MKNVTLDTTVLAKGIFPPRRRKKDTIKDERGIQASDYVKTHANIIHDISFLEESIKIAVKTRISGFDSIFIACAKITNSILITDDKKMHNASIKVGVDSKLLREISI